MRADTLAFALAFGKCIRRSSEVVVPRRFLVLNPASYRSHVIPYILRLATPEGSIAEMSSGVSLYDIHVSPPPLSEEFIADEDFHT